MKRKLFSKKFKLPLYKVIWKYRKYDRYSYEILNSSVHEFCKEMNDIIESAVVFERGSFSWFVSGIGCNCSEFKILNPQKVPSEVLDHILVNQTKYFSKESAVHV